MTRTSVSSGAPWEQTYGYRRAVRIGNVIAVAGTAPVGDDGKTYAPGEPYAQARRCFEVALQAATELGARPEDVIRTRMYVTDMRFADDFGRAHMELFGAHPPAATMVEVRRLVRPDMLIEVEVEAVLP